jgi:hypothetical protein
MSWRDQAAAAVADESAAGSEPTKLTEPGIGGFGGTDPAPISSTQAPGLAEVFDQEPVAGVAVSIPELSETSACEGVDCSGCDRLEMRAEAIAGTRRRFFWKCLEGYRLLEGRNYGERVILAPPECASFEPWQPGTR